MTDERAHQELRVLLTLGPVVIASKGQSTAEVEHTYTRALALCHRLNTTRQRVAVVAGLRRLYAGRGDYPKAQALSEELLALAQQEHDPALLVEAHYSLGHVLFLQGAFGTARTHLTQAFTADAPHHIPTQIARYGTASGLLARSYASLALWVLGYLDQARYHLSVALPQARELAHPLSWAQTFSAAGVVHHLQRQAERAQEQAEALLTLATEQESPTWVSGGMISRGWALVVQGEHEEGSTQLRQGIAAYPAVGTAAWLSYFLLLQAESYGATGHAAQGLQALDEALQIIERTGGRWWEAELWRRKGELTLEKSRVQGPKSGVWSPKKSKGKRQNSKISNPQPLTPNPQVGAEAYFHKAIKIARQQQAKSLELRAVMSLSRLWQQQGKGKEAHQMLSEVYGWFTEGFDTKDLQEAEALIEELGEKAKRGNGEKEKMKMG